MDKMLMALEEADDIWRKAQRYDNKTKFDAAQKLHTYGLFSFNQLAKICRTNVPYLTRRMHSMYAVGGRFEPEALSVLIMIRTAVLRGDDIGDNLIRIATNAGCSISCISTLTGLPRSYTYKRVASRNTRNY